MTQRVIQVLQRLGLAYQVVSLCTGDLGFSYRSGKLIVENKKLLTMAEDEILAFSREMGRKLWQKMQK